MPAAHPGFRPTQLGILAELLGDVECIIQLLLSLSFPNYQMRVTVHDLYLNGFVSGMRRHDQSKAFVLVPGTERK